MKKMKSQNNAEIHYLYYYSSSVKNKNVKCKLTGPYKTPGKSMIVFDISAIIAPPRSWERTRGLRWTAEGQTRRPQTPKCSFD